MSKIKFGAVETGIQIPPPMKPKGRQPRKDSITSMLCGLKIGQSIFFEAATKDLNGHLHKARRRSNYKFVTRLVKEGTVQGCRVWRVSAKGAAK